MSSKTQEQQPDKPFPASLETECSVFGAVLIGSVPFADIRRLRPIDFSIRKHQFIFAAMEGLFDRGVVIDHLTVFTELQRRGQDDEVGGLSYLTDLDDRVVRGTENVDHWLDILKNRSILRGLICVTDVIQKRCFLQAQDPADLLESGLNTFRNLKAELNPAEEAPSIPEWPEPIAEAGYHGLAGELVSLLAPETESDPAALLIQILVGWGSLIGRGPYYLAEADKHHTNLYAVLVGTTSKGRKGTSWGRTRAFLGALDEHWVENCLVGGVGSGEALIEALGDVTDRRHLVLEGEFARLLAVLGREGNTLSAIFRNGWDSGTADIRTRQNKVHVTGAHLSMIGHITKDELLRRLTDTELGNGLANRISWCCVRRSNVLPHGGGSPDLSRPLRCFMDATEFARKMGNTRMEFDSEARSVWEEVYPALSEGGPGLLGAITSRAEAQTVRLALVYALLDGSPKIRVEHLQAGLAVWRYCFDSARFIWGDKLGDPTADTILAAVKASADGLSKWDINNLFNRNRSASEIDRALGLLTERNLVRSKTEEGGGGRPVVRFTRASM